MNCAAVLLLASLVLGQSERPDRNDDFRKLRGFLGTWEAKDIEMEGRKVDSYSSWKPILDGRFIELKWMFTNVSDTSSEWGLVILGTDPADGKVRGWGFDNRGGLMAMELNGWEGDKSNWSSEFVAADGKKQKSVANSFGLLDKNSHEWLLAFDDGQDKAVFKRARQKADLWPEPQFDTPAGISEQLKDLDWWAGDSTIEGVDSFTGKTIVGQTKCGWVCDGKFLLEDTSTVDSDMVFGRYRAITGVDPATTKTTGWEFDSTGTVGRYTVSDKGQDIVGTATSSKAGRLDFKGRMTKTADGLEYRATGNLPEDKKVNYQMTYRKRK